jgi:multiple sugar transport system substrate-binding protein
MAAVKRVGGPGKYAVLLPLNEWVPVMVLGLSAGSPILADGGTRGAFSGPEFKSAFRFFVGLFRDGLAPPIANTEIANLYQDFERGHFSMYITGPWNLGEFRRRLPPAAQDSWCTAPLPGPTGKESGLSIAGGSSLVVFRGSRHKEEAFRLIEFLSRPEQQLRFYRLCGDLPARMEPWSDPALAQDPCLAAFGEQLTRVKPLPPVPEMEQIAIRLQDWSERAVRGALAPDSALARLDREVDRMLEKRRWLAAHRKPAGPTASAGGAP